MLLARVVGNVVATKKDARLEGRKLLVVEAITPAGEGKGSHLVAVDAVGAGVGETVLAVQGSSARMTEGLKDIPVDTAIVGIVDQVEIDEPPPAPKSSSKKKKAS